MDTSRYSSQLFTQLLQQAQTPPNSTPSSSPYIASFSYAPPNRPFYPNHYSTQISNPRGVGMGMGMGIQQVQAQPTVQVPASLYSYYYPQYPISYQPQEGAWEQTKLRSTTPIPSSFLHASSAFLSQPSQADFTNSFGVQFNVSPSSRTSKSPSLSPQLQSFLDTGEIIPPSPLQTQKYKSQLLSQLSDDQKVSPKLKSANGGVLHYPSMDNILQTHRKCPCKDENCNVLLKDDIIAPIMSPGRLHDFEAALASQDIDINALRNMSSQGIPAPVRGITWQILLGYLPGKASFRASILSAKRTRYANLIQNHCGDTFVRPHSEMKNILNEQAQLIRVDAERTRPEGFGKVFGTEDMMQALCRILLIWSSTHPVIGYFQGLNDIVCPLLIVFLDHHSRDNTKNTSTLEDYALSETVGDNFVPNAHTIALAEADTYWCLCALLDSLNHFVERSKCGVHAEGMMVELERLMKSTDPDLVQHVHDEGVEFVHFAFRWMLCLFVREVHMDLLIPLWDFYVSYVPTPNSLPSISTLESGPPSIGIGFSWFHIYICAAFLLRWSDEVKSKNFMGIVQFLQNPPTVNWNQDDLEDLIRNARCLTKNHKI